MKKLSTFCLSLCLFLPGVLTYGQEWMCQGPADCARLMRDLDAEQERMMARMVRAELGSGGREKLLRLGERACSAKGNTVAGATLRRLDEGHRMLYVLEFPGRSLTVVRLNDRDCSGLDVYLDAERPHWHHLSNHKYSFYVPVEGDVLIDRDEYGVFLEENAFWKALNAETR